MPRPATVQQVRYWITAALRIVAGCLIGFGGIELLSNLGQVVARSIEMSQPPDLLGLTMGLAFGPGLFLAGGAALVYWSRAIARWIAPMATDACPECSYPVGPSAERCPECGAALR